MYRYSQQCDTHGKALLLDLYETGQYTHWSGLVVGWVVNDLYELESPDVREQGSSQDGETH